MKIKAISFCGTSYTEVFCNHKNLFLEGTLDPYGELDVCLKALDIILSDDNYHDILLDFSQNFDMLRRPELLSAPSKKIYLCLEPPVVQRAHHLQSVKKLTGLYDYVLSVYGDHVDDKTIFQINTPYCFDFAYTPTCNYKDKKLITNISGNKSSPYQGELYSKRVEAIRYFENKHPEDFDLYGRGWTTEEYPSYKGSVDDKFAAYQQYKFAVCFENNICQGGITEKIFDCFLCRCVPVYLGCVNILDYIPEGCFVDYRQFASIDDLYRFLTQMTEEQYNQYIDNIEAYLQSSQKDIFTPEHFAEQIYKASQMPKRHKYSIWQGWKAKWFRLRSRVGVYDICDIPIFFTRILNKLKRAQKG